jgi:hypothetical protein
MNCHAEPKYYFNTGMCFKPLIICVTGDLSHGTTVNRVLKQDNPCFVVLRKYFIHVMAEAGKWVAKTLAARKPVGAVQHRL